MLDFGMASIAFDLAIGDVSLMQEFRSKCGVSKFMPLMTFQALILRNVAISFIDADVALKTTNPSLDISLVVKAYPLDRDIPFRLDMA
jgi:hypothetical protein